MTTQSFRLAKLCLLILLAGVGGLAQSRTQTETQTGNLFVYGDFRIRLKSDEAPPAQATLILVRQGAEIARQKVSNGGSYRFSDLVPGEYEIITEINLQEVTRTRVVMSSLHHPSGRQQDLTVALSSTKERTKPQTISAADLYERPVANRSLFKKAEEAVAANQTDRAIGFLKQIVTNDQADFQAQAILGTLLASEGKYDEAEQAFLNALSAKPNFPPALLDFGRLRFRQKRFAEAIEPLTKLVGLQPESGEANLLLGDAYVQMNLSSKAIPYLQSAATFGYPEAHLRLAWVYNATGLKEKAAVEYEEFLKKKPDYADRQKLEGYIKANKKN